MAESPVPTPLPSGMKGLAVGVRAFVAGYRLMLPGGGMFRYAIAPGLVALFTLLSLAVGAFFLARWLLVDWLTSLDWAPWLSWLGGVLAFVLALVFSYFLFVPVMRMLGPIFLDPIAERVHQRVTGQPLPQAPPNVAIRLAGSIVPSLRSLLLSLFVELPLAIFAMLTFAGVVVSAPVSAFLMGWDLVDTSLSLHNLKWSAKKAWLRRNFWPCIGLGGTASLVLLVPVLNLLAVPAGVAGAMVLVLAERDQRGQTGA